jgi:hypothetical protein
MFFTPTLSMSMVRGLGRLWTSAISNSDRVGMVDFRVAMINPALSGETTS